MHPHSWIFNIQYSQSVCVEQLTTHRYVAGGALTSHNPLLQG